MSEQPIGNEAVYARLCALPIQWEGVVLKCRKAGTGSLTGLSEKISEQGGRTIVPS